MADCDFKWAFSTGGYVNSSPCVGNDGVIFFGSNDHYIYAVRSDGTELWKYLTGSQVISSPILSPDKSVVYVGSDDGYLYAINVADGSLKWRFLFEIAGVWLRSSPAVDTNGIIYASSNVSGDFALYALNPDGTQKWKYSYGEDSFEHPSPAIARDGTIYCYGETSLHAINPDGSNKWIYPVGISQYQYYSAPAIAEDGTIYIGTEQKELHAVNPDGTNKWIYTTDNRIGSSSPAIGSDGTIYVGEYNGKYLHAINTDGTNKWKYDCGDKIYSSPTIDENDVIWFGAIGGILYAVNSDGTLKCSCNIGAAVLFSSPCIAQDGTVYIGSYTNDLTAVESSGAPLYYPKKYHDNLMDLYFTMWRNQDPPAAPPKGGASALLLFAKMLMG